MYVPQYIYVETLLPNYRQNDFTSEKPPYAVTYSVALTC